MSLNLSFLGGAGTVTGSKYLLERENRRLLVIPLLPMGRWFGFVAPPPSFFFYLIAATTAYLALVEIAKYFFYRIADGL